MRKVNQTNRSVKGPQENLEIKQAEGELSPTKESINIQQKLDKLCEKLRKGETCEVTFKLIGELKQALGEEALLSNDEVYAAVRDRLSDILIRVSTSMLRRKRNDPTFKPEEPRKIEIHSVLDSEDYIDFVTKNKIVNVQKLLSDDSLQILQVARDELCKFLKTPWAEGAERVINFVRKYENDNFNVKNLFSDYKKIRTAAWDGLCYSAGHENWKARGELSNFIFRYRTLLHEELMPDVADGWSATE